MPKLVRMFGVLAMLLSLSTAADGQTAPHGALRIRIDTSNAEATLALLDGDPTPAEVARFTSLRSTADLARRAQGWQLQLTPTDLAAMVEQARNGARDAMGYHGVMQDRERIAALIQRTVSEREAIERFLNERLGPYLPAGRNLEIEVVMLLGGRSAGFTFGEARRMYVGAQFYQGDFLGYRNMLLHEVFHNVQAALFEQPDLATCLTEGERRAFDYLQAVYREGTAEYVADIWEYGEDAPYTAAQRRQLGVNRNPWRLQVAGQLIDFAVVNAVNNPNGPDPAVLATVLTDWNWHNPAYYYGYHAMRALSQRHGRERLRHYLRQGPVPFMQDYLALTGEQAPPNQFSPEFRQIVNQLAAKMAACPARAPARS